MTQERPPDESDAQTQPAGPADEPVQRVDEDDVVEAAATPKPVVSNGARGRRLLAALFWLLASVTVLFAGVAVWAHQTLLSSDGWGGIVADVIAHEEVTDAASVVLVDRLADSLGVEEIVADVLPGPDFIAGAVTGAVQERITDRVADFAQGDTFQRAFVNANVAAHEAAMKAIRGGDSEALTSQGGIISLNVFPLIEGLLLSLQDAGIIDAGRDIPDLTDYAAPDQAIALIETVLGRDIPDDAGTIVLVDSENLELVQTAIRWFDAITIVLLLLWVLFTGLALWLARRRIRMVLWLSGGAIAALLAGRFLTRLLLEAVTRRQPELEARVVAGAVIDAAVDSLMWFTFVLMFVALVVAVIAVIGERRDRLERLSLETPPRTLGRWVRDNMAIVLGAGAAVIGVMAFWAIGGPGIAMLVAAAVLLLAIAVKVMSDQAGDEPGSAGRD